MTRRDDDVPRCGAGLPRAGRTCRWPAGWGTAHPGLGHCRYHGGTRRAEEEAWRVATELGRERDVSPWDALLLSVRLAAGRVEWVDARLREVERQHDGDPDAREVHTWLAESRNERRLLARAAKAAVDAGVAERLVRQVELESAVIVRVLGRTLDALDLDDDRRVRAFEVVHAELLAIGGPEDLREDVGGTP